jgi:hypothetical protein
MAVVVDPKWSTQRLKVEMCETRSIKSYRPDEVEMVEVSTNATVVTAASVLAAAASTDGDVDGSNVAGNNSSASKALIREESRKKYHQMKRSDSSRARLQAKRRLPKAKALPQAKAPTQQQSHWLADSQRLRSDASSGTAVPSSQSSLTRSGSRHYTWSAVPMTEMTAAYTLHFDQLRVQEPSARAFFSANEAIMRSRQCSYKRAEGRAHQKSMALRDHRKSRTAGRIV